MDYDCKEFCPNALRIYYLVKYIEGSTSNVHVSGFDISLFAYEHGLRIPNEGINQRYLKK